MNTLSNLNDLAGFWISLAIVGGATILLVFLWRKRSPVIVQSLGISTHSH